MRSLRCRWPNGFVPPSLNASSVLLRLFKRTLFKLSFRSRRNGSITLSPSNQASFLVTSPATANVNNDCISLQPFHDEEDFGTSTLTDVEENELLLTICGADSATKASNNPNSSVSPSAAEIGDVPSFSDTFNDPWSKVCDDGLDLSLFFVEEKVQIDLLQTLKRLKAPMIAYDEVMKWAVRSCSKGLFFATCRSLPVRPLWTSCVDVLASTPSLLL